jgi:pimeloyl-ACP methyl ester carboxylesterase
VATLVDSSPTPDEHWGGGDVSRNSALAVPLVASALVALAAGAERATTFLDIRGKPQTLRIYGQRTGPPVIVLSGDGGWVHLAPQVAETLDPMGFFVVGFDCKAYLSAFTQGDRTLTAADVPGDIQRLVHLASTGSTERPILIGVSEGAGLATLAATDEAVKRTVGGVIALGLPDVNELGWRWRDSIIYLTRETPREPTFTVSAIVGKVAPLPLAEIHSTHDEFVPLADAQKLMGIAKEPKRQWVVAASNHRFSGNEAEFSRRLLEAIAWVKAHQPRR